MDLQPYVDGVRLELEIAAAAGGEEAAELAERLTAPLDSALRLALLEALSEAAEHITRELAPASVDVRLRGRDPEFAVTGAQADAEPAPSAVADADGAVAVTDDGGTWRVTLRLPEGLRGGVDAAARRDGLSVNAWLVRAVGAALGGSTPRDRKRGSSVTGWVR
ncbi:histidine kinase [Mycolicibacterium mucogenicum]|uniref:histidine kinase n=1 Tax=Mycolicibacterium TaxID=1866885 RepID=UPI002269D377|nr:MULTISPECIES: histidine kinase [Mycolicibacterium]MCX8561404.1 histidine kinase [Mycolicibacterium mucogenicum]